MSFFVSGFPCNPPSGFPLAWGALLLYKFCPLLVSLIVELLQYDRFDSVTIGDIICWIGRGTAGSRRPCDVQQFSSAPRMLLSSLPAHESGGRGRRGPRPEAAVCCVVQCRTTQHFGRLKTCQMTLAVTAAGKVGDEDSRSASIFSWIAEGWKMIKQRPHLRHEFPIV